MLPPELGDGAGGGPREVPDSPGRRGRHLLTRGGRGGRVYLSSADVRLSISVITSAISYFSLCQKGGTSVGAGSPPPSSRTQEVRLREPLPGVSPAPTGRGHQCLSLVQRAPPSQSRPAPEQASLCLSPSETRGCTRQARGVHVQSREGTRGTPSRCRGTKARRPVCPPASCFRPAASLGRLGCR